MIIHGLLFYFGIVFFSLMYASDNMQLQRSMTRDRIIDGVIVRVAKMQDCAGDYIRLSYAEEGYDPSRKLYSTEKKRLLKSGMERVLWSPEISKSTTKEQQDKIWCIRSKQAYIVLAAVPSDIKKLILPYIFPEFTDQAVLDKANVLSIADLFLWYADCKDEPVQKLSQVQLQYRFLCSPQQIDMMRTLIQSSEKELGTQHTYYDYKKKCFPKIGYTVSSKEKELLVTVPELFMEADFCNTIFVAEKQSSIKRICETVLILICNQGIEVYDSDSNLERSSFFPKGWKARSFITLFSSMTALISPVFSLSPIASGFFNFFQNGPFILQGLNMPLKYTLKGVDHRLIIGILSVILNMSLAKCLAPKMADIIVPSFVIATMVWDYFKYGVTYSCKSRTVKQLWHDAQKNIEIKKGKYCTIL